MSRYLYSIKNVTFDVLIVGLICLVFLLICESVADLSDQPNY